MESGRLTEDLNDFDWAKDTIKIEDPDIRSQDQKLLADVNVPAMNCYLNQ